MVTAPSVTHAPSGYIWTAKSPMPTARSQLSAVAAGGYIFVMGGIGTQQVALATNERYDPSNDQWTARTGIPSGGRADFGAATLNGKVYIAGGVDAIGNCLSSMEEFDVTTDTWRSRTGMSVARAGLALVAAGGVLFAPGGRCLEPVHLREARDML